MSSESERTKEDDGMQHENSVEQPQRVRNRDNIGEPVETKHT